MRAAAFVLFSALVAASASAQPASCKPVIDALHKQWATPNHLTIVQSGRPQPIEAITIGDTAYVKLQGDWIKSPQSPSESRVDQDAKLKNAKVLTCRLLRDASLNGVAANVFALHTEDDENTNDGQYWIAKATGLPIKLESSVNVGDGMISRLVSTWDYANVHAPVVK